MEQVKTVWLTGASSGIGEALVRRFAAEGKRVALTGRDRAKLDGLIAAVGAGPGDLLAVPADVSDPEQVAIAYERIKGEWGVPDMVIANAGTHINMPASQLDIAKCRLIFDLNLTGAVATLLVGLEDEIRSKLDHKGDHFAIGHLETAGAGKGRTFRKDFVV